MEQPKTFVFEANSHKVCKLNKSIYGLMQASYRWYLHFEEVVKTLGFIKNEDELCVYNKVNGSKISFLKLFIDDILLIGNDIGMLTSVKASLALKHILHERLGEATCILRIHYYRDRVNMMMRLSEALYLEKVLKIFGMENSKSGFYL